MNGFHECQKSYTAAIRSVPGRFGGRLSHFPAYPPPPPGRLMMFTAANIAIPSCNQAQDVVG